MNILHAIVTLGKWATRKQRSARKQATPPQYGRSILVNCAGNTLVLVTGNEQARNDAPVHCGKAMAMRRGRYVCRVCGAEY